MRLLLIVVVALLTSALYTAAMLRWFNPLRETLTNYRRLVLVQQDALATAGEVIRTLLIRSAGKIYCDECGQIIEVGELGCVRPGDRGRFLIGHERCFPEPEPAPA